MSSKKTIRLSFVLDALEKTTNGWQQFYNVTTGEIESIPDSDNSFANTNDYEEICENIDNSDDYIRLPAQYDLHEYGIMERFAEKKNDAGLINALRGRKPFRSFKDTATEHGLIDEYYRYRTEVFANVARGWCKDNNIPYIDDFEQNQIQRLDYDLTVCKVSKISDIDLNTDFYFIGKTDKEISLVCLTKDAPENTVECEDGWKGFRIAGTLDFSLIGVLSKITSILAENKIGIIAVSTYDTDYILVKTENFEKSLYVLADKGYEII